MKRFTLPFMALGVLSLAAIGFAQTPPPNQHLKPLRPLLGKWTGEFTLQQDMAGVARAGETVPVVTHYKWTANRNAIILSVSARVQDRAVNVTNGLIVWDAQQKKIVGMDTYVTGGIYRYEIQPHDNRIVLEGKGVTAEGVPTSSTIELRDVTRAGLICQFLNQREGDKEIPDSAPMVLTRVKNVQDDQPSAYEHLKGLEWMVGSKAGEYTAQEGWDEFAPVGSKVVRRTSVRWALNRSLLIANMSQEIDGRPPVKWMEIIGWDPMSQQIVHWILSPGGGSGSGTWSQEGDEWQLRWTSTNAQGTVHTGIGRMRPTGPGTSEWRITDATKNGKKIDDIPKVVFTRQ